MGPQGWQYPPYWEGDVRDRNNKLPIEMAITEELGKVPTLKYTIRYRVNPDRTHIDEDIFAYRMYLTFAPHGDLQSLIDKHLRCDDPANNVRIPEPFIW